MTRDEIIHAIKSKDNDWLWSRWSVLNNAVKSIEPHLAAVEAAFDYDYTTVPSDEDKFFSVAALQKYVCDQVLALCNVVTTHDTEGTVSWGELLELIDLEIKRRGNPPEVPYEPGQPLPSTDFDDWWDLKGRYMKNEPGENINDTELPHRVAIAAWKADKERGSNS